MNFQQVKCLLLGSPGFVKDDFFEFLNLEATRREERVSEISPMLVHSHGISSAARAPLHIGLSFKIEEDIYEDVLVYKYRFFTPSVYALHFRPQLSTLLCRQCKWCQGATPVSKPRHHLPLVYVLPVVLPVGATLLQEGTRLPHTPNWPGTHGLVDEWPTHVTVTLTFPVPTATKAQYPC